MSNIINLDQTALYGFIWEWGNNAFNGKINVGEYEDQKFGVFPQNYYYQGGKNNSQTYTGTTWLPSQIYYYNMVYPSTLSGGSQLGGLSVNAGGWTGNTVTEQQPTSIQASYKNLYTLLSPISGNNSGTITVLYPVQFNDVPATGGSYEGVNQSFESYGSPTFYVTSSVQDEDVVYAPIASNSLSITNGDITYSTQSLAQGTNLNFVFTFLPGATPAIELSSQFTQRISTNNTQGTSQSGSTSGSNTATFGITDTVTASVGLDESDSVSNELQSSYSDAWQTAWSNTSSANFSTTNAISSTSSFDFTITENLNGAIETGKQKTTNGNVTPLYQYTTTYTDPITQQPTTTTVDLIAGGTYEWTLQYYKGEIQNVASGQYTLSGYAGNVEDTIGNEFGGNIAQAFYYANQGQAWDNLGYGYNPIASFNSSDPDQITSVQINGSTTSSTSVSANLVLSLSAVSSVSSPSSTTSSSALLQSSILGDERAKLDRRKWVNIVDGLLLRPEDTLNSSSYYGDASANYVRDTHGQDLIRTDNGQDSVIIRGNTVQANNGGDIVYLGAGSDLLDARRAKGANTVNAESGNDEILDGRANLMADLGDGDDRFIYGGGYDILKLGLGRDNIQIKRGKGGIVVHDYEVGQDTITGLSKSSRLTWNDELACFTIAKSDRVTGNLFTTTSTAAQDPEFWYGVALQNHQSLKFDPTLSNLNDWKYTRSRYGRYGFNQENLKTKSWQDFSKSRSHINNAATFIAECSDVSDLSKRDYRQIGKLADVSTSYYDFIAATTTYLL